ncbi:MAG: DUF2207 domain-containing protein [Candidatus Moraniibacteriota bacterium]|nr:MAG: DUF2207 domain-containing protein [Candidatus Moranbacteria bacterium]
MKKIHWWRILCVSVFFFFGMPLLVWAKSYTYESIDVDIDINKDATILVREKQVFQFSGEFHKGYREIILNGTDAIRDIAVYDERGVNLSYQKNLSQEYIPGLEGNYNYQKSGGFMKIWWFFDAQDETKTFTLEYTVVGALSFFDDKDELYWNILTDYDVAIASSTVQISLPEESEMNTLKIKEYLQGDESSFSEILNEKTALASATQLQSGADFTVAFGFPRGIIDRGAYWESLFSLYWGYILGVLIWLITLIFCLGYWYMSEKYNKGRGTIIAEYEPPHHLPPAIGEVIMKEKISSKTWASTIIDLAVRGHVKIEEEPVQAWMKYLIFLPGIIGAFFVGQIIFVMMPTEDVFLKILALCVFIGIGVISFTKDKNKGRFEKKEYKLFLIKDNAKDILRPFEKEFLSVLFSGRAGVFSTREIKKEDELKRQMMYRKFQALQKSFFDEVAQLGFHNHSLKKESYGKTGLIFFFFGLFFLSSFIGFWGSWHFLIATLLGASALISYFIWFEVKLTPEGNEEKEKWLGFKEFLYKTERYRVQELTPDMFYTLLPYAMIFGIERQWAKRFEGIVVNNPDWHTSPTMSTSGSSSFVSSGSVGAFSAGAFSASLSSSFSSAFASSSGSSGGASGGGGSAGGGGGGGGGGAS